MPVPSLPRRRKHPHWQPFAASVLRICPEVQLHAHPELSAAPAAPPVVPREANSGSVILATSDECTLRVSPNHLVSPPDPSSWVLFVQAHTTWHHLASESLDRGDTVQSAVDGCVGEGKHDLFSTRRAYRKLKIAAAKDQHLLCLGHLTISKTRGKTRRVLRSAKHGTSPGCPAILNSPDEETLLRYRDPRSVSGNRAYFRIHRNVRDLQPGGGGLPRRSRRVEAVEHAILIILT